VRLFYTDHFVLPFPEKYRFPMRKYSLLRERCEQSELLAAVDLQVPAAVNDRQILLAHNGDYLQQVTAGSLSRPEELRMGFPWSPELVERSRRSCGATLAACRSALEDGFSANLAGGTHHAFRNRGEGYCVFNDTVMAARTLQSEGRAPRVLVIDCDVHQGNGTAAITEGDDSIYTFSIHGAKNFPARKERSDLDVPLPDATADEEYLDALTTALPTAFDSSHPDLVIYLAGADPFEEDRLGRLSLSTSGLARRDGLVYERCRRSGVPVAASMAGGYAPNVDDIVSIHFETICQGVATFN